MWWRGGRLGLWFVGGEGLGGRGLGRGGGCLGRGGGGGTGGRGGGFGNCEIVFISFVGDGVGRGGVGRETDDLSRRMSGSQCSDGSGGGGGFGTCCCCCCWWEEDICSGVA